MYVCVYIYIYIYLYSVSLSLSLSVCLSVCLSLSLYIYIKPVWNQLTLYFSSVQLLPSNRNSHGEGNFSTLVSSALSLAGDLIERYRPSFCVRSLCALFFTVCTWHSALTMPADFLPTGMYWLWAAFSSHCSCLRAADRSACFVDHVIGRLVCLQAKRTRTRTRKLYFTRIVV